jgi:glycerol-3-phosphate dehydrogenase (NAD(P)+)
MNQVYLIGNGSWGTALISLFSTDLPLIWVFRSSQKKNLAALANYNREINFSLNLEGLTEASLVVMATPSEALIHFVQEHLLDVKPFLLITSKGLDMERRALYSSTLVELGYPVLKIAFLAGASYAQEIIENHRTLVTLSTLNEDYSERLARLLSRKSSFVCEHYADIERVQLWAVVKNFIAFMAGYFYGQSHSSMYYKRQAIFHAILIDFDFFMSEFFNKSLFDQYGYSACIGDCYLSGTSKKSRNYSYGVLVAQGLDDDTSTIEVKNTLNFLRAQDLTAYKFLESFLAGSFSLSHPVGISPENLDKALVALYAPTENLSAQWKEFLKENAKITSKNEQAFNIVEKAKNLDVKCNYITLITHLIAYDHELTARIHDQAKPKMLLWSSGAASVGKNPLKATEIKEKSISYCLIS